MVITSHLITKSTRTHWKSLTFLGRAMSAVNHIKSTKIHGSELLGLCRSIVPPLNQDLHKGQLGRIGIIGGSKEYTGAPYFAGISALKAGADLVHIFSSKDSSHIIKAYSPDLIVHPLLDTENGLEEIKVWMERIHSVVVGPGLGRDEKVFELLKEIIPFIKERDMPLIIDADGLWFINKNLDMIRGYHKAVLTPNAVEFQRLLSICKDSVLLKTSKVISTDLGPGEIQEETAALSAMLGNITIVLKGKNDVISNGSKVIVCDSDGSPRRCGGQGDLLSGFLGTFANWAYNSSQEHPSLLASYASCLLTRQCSVEAFKIHGRSTMSSDLVTQINSSFVKLYGV